MEAIFLECDAGGPQLKRNPLGATVNTRMTREHGSYLSTADRSRLRPTIDVEALERFFAATPRGFHRFFFLACVARLSDAERRELGFEGHVPPQLHGIADPEAHWPARQYHFMVAGLLNAGLRTLWEEVEPSQDRGA